jgi:hypothetical protein
MVSFGLGIRLSKLNQLFGTSNQTKPNHKTTAHVGGRKNRWIVQFRFRCGYGINVFGLVSMELDVVDRSVEVEKC